MKIALFHLALASLSLLAVAAASAIVLACWRTRFSAGYRLVVAVLAGTLALAALQVVLERSGLELVAPFTARLLRLTRVVAPARSELQHAPALAGPVDLERGSARAVASLPEREPLEPGAASAGNVAFAPVDAPGGLALLLVGSWAAGVVYFLGRTARRVSAARALLAGSDSALDADLARTWRETARAWPGASRVELRVSDELEAPACFGFFRRAILLPRHAQRLLEPACLGHVLLHELIHLERRDAWALCLAELVRALYWFHPAAWWLCRKAEELRELSCDALVIERAGRPRTYARGLVACAERLRSPHPLTAALPSWSGSKSQFSRRIEMLLQPSSRPKSIPWPTKVLIGACFAFCGGAQLALAASPPQEREPEKAVPRTAPVPEPYGRQPLPGAPSTGPMGVTPELEKGLRAMGYAQEQPPAPLGIERRGDRIARATELVERALARNPGDEDLREAIELLRQAREPLDAFWEAQPETEKALKSYADAQRLSAKGAAEEADRYARRKESEARRLYSGGERERLEEKTRDYLERSRARTEPRANDPSQFEAQLERTLKVLEDQRAQLDRLREQIEDLRKQARGIEAAPAPRAGPRGAR